MAKLQRKADSVGLGSPVRILTDEFKDCLSYEREQKRLLSGSASKALLTDSVEDEDQIMYEVDEVEAMEIDG